MKKIDLPLSLSTYNSWAKMHSAMIFLCIIVFLGAILRFHNFTDLLRFNNDQVRDAKIIENMITEHEFPLLGPKAGGTTFKLGPAFYYMEYLSARIFGNTPQGIALFIPIFGTLSIILFYILLKKYFADHIALFLTLLYATSFYVIKYSRFAWNPNLIPFFLFLFFLIILKTLSPNKKQDLWWFCGLGIAAGIAMQLHTTLLILLPILIALTHGINYVRTKNRFLCGIAITYSIIFLMHSPMFIYDMQHNGENITAFFHGSETKSENGGSLVKNILLDGQFFIQSTAYIITGFEPTRNWLDVKKLIVMHNYTEICVAISYSTLFLLAVILFLRRSHTFLTAEQKEIRSLFLITALLCFMLFWPIAHEINTRFFIILVFVPFMLIGTFFHAICNAKNLSPKIRSGMTMICIICLVALNLSAYIRTYDLTNTQISSDVYGGISLAELHTHVTYMASHTNLQKIYMLPNTFNQSFRYIAQTDGHTLTTKSVGNIPLNTPVFFVSDKPHKTELSQSLQKCFTIIDSYHHGRFRTFTIQKISEQCD